MSSPPNPSLLGTGRIFRIISTCGARLAGVIENPVRSKLFAYLQPALDGCDFLQQTCQRCAYDACRPPRVAKSYNTGVHLSLCLGFVQV